MYVDECVIQVIIAPQPIFRIFVSTIYKSKLLYIQFYYFFYTWKSL